MTEVILDTGPLVAFLNREDTHHAWAVDQFRTLPPGFITCEAVLAETAFLVAFASVAVDELAWLINQGWIKVPFQFSNESSAVLQLMRRYRNVPMSFADACLVRMAEMFDKSSVFTIDSDFRIYRKHGRRMIPAILPAD